MFLDEDAEICTDCITDFMWWLFKKLFERTSWSYRVFDKCNTLGDAQSAVLAEYMRHRRQLKEVVEREKLLQEYAKLKEEFDPLEDEEREARHQRYLELKAELESEELI